jgi:hypothetical protein
MLTSLDHLWIDLIMSPAKFDPVGVTGSRNDVIEAYDCVGCFEDGHFWESIDYQYQLKFQRTERSRSKGFGCGCSGDLLHEDW